MAKKADFKRLTKQTRPRHGERCVVVTRNKKNEEVEVEAIWDGNRGAFAKPRTDPKRKGERVRATFFRPVETTEAQKETENKDGK